MRIGLRPEAGRAALRVIAGGLLALSVAGGASAAFVRDTILSVRPSPGSGERLGIVRSGDEVAVLEKSDRYTRVRTADGTIGWVPSGFLKAEKPPIVSVEVHESTVTDLQNRLDIATVKNAELEEVNATLSARDTEQRSEVERLTMDNMELRAGARWPEWITGASVLVAGMLVGAILHRNATRRPSSRIRL